MVRARWSIAAVLVTVGCTFDSQSPGMVGFGGTTETVDDTTTTTPTSGASGSSAATSDTPTSTAPTSMTGPPDTATDDGTSATTTPGDSSSTTGEPAEFDVGPFGDPVRVPGVNSSAGDDDPTLTADLLEMYFSSHRDGDENIYRAARSGTDQDFVIDGPVDIFNDIFGDTSPDLSPDGLTITLSKQDTIDGLEIWVSTRPDTAGTDWSDPIHVAELGSADDDLSLTLTDDLLVGYLCRRSPIFSDIFRVERDDPSGMFGPVVLVAEFGTADFECNPWIEPLGRVIVADSGTTAANSDLVWSRIEGASLTAPQVITELASPYEDSDPWLSPDGELIVFSRRIDGGVQQILWAERLP